MHLLALNMQNLIKRLEKRDWKKREIDKAISIIKKAKNSKPEHILFIEKRINWILLFVIIVANFAISVALIPILMALRGLLLYLVIVILGIVFGLLFELVIRSIEYLEIKHHILLSIFIPLIALASAFVVSNFSNDLMAKLSLTNIHNPILIAIIYSISFVLPYIVYRFILKIEYYAKE